eukprot:SAG22_NODE_1648_length_3898_cov_6.783890_4_plen_487_part_01
MRWPTAVRSNSERTRCPSAPPSALTVPCLAAWARSVRAQKENARLDEVHQRLRLEKLLKELTVKYERCAESEAKLRAFKRQIGALSSRPRTSTLDTTSPCASPPDWCPGLASWGTNAGPAFENDKKRVAELQVQVIKLTHALSNPNQALKSVHTFIEDSEKEAEEARREAERAKRERPATPPPPLKSYNFSFQQTGRPVGIVWEKRERFDRLEIFVEAIEDASQAERKGVPPDLQLVLRNVKSEAGSPPLAGLRYRDVLNILAHAEKHSPMVLTLQEPPRTAEEAAAAAAGGGEAGKKAAEVSCKALPFCCASNAFFYLRQCLSMRSIDLGRRRRRRDHRAGRSTCRRSAVGPPSLSLCPIYASYTAQNKPSTHHSDCDCDWNCRSDDRPGCHERHATNERAGASNRQSVLRMLAAANHEKAAPPKPKERLALHGADSGAETDAETDTAGETDGEGGSRPSTRGTLPSRGGGGGGGGGQIVAAGGGG